jgi:hypothetical protein
MLLRVRLPAARHESKSSTGALGGSMRSPTSHEMTIGRHLLGTGTCARLILSHID